MTTSQKKELYAAIERAIRVELLKNMDGFKTLPWFVQTQKNTCADHLKKAA